MKNRISIVVLLFMFGNLFSQSITVIDPNNPMTQRLPLTNEQFFEQAEFIFEGRIIADSWESYDVIGNLESGEGFYTSYIIEVKHVYKGGDKIKTGTIEVVSKGGRIYAENEMGWVVPYEHFPINRGPSAGTANDAVFFCKTSELPQNPKPRTFDNAISVSFFISRPYAVLRIDAMDWPIKFNNYIRGLNYLNFANKAEFYQYLRQFKGLNIPTKDDNLKNGGCSIEKIEGQKELLKAFMLKQEQMVKIAKGNKQDLKNRGVDTYSTLTIEIQGQTVTGTKVDSSPKCDTIIKRSLGFLNIKFFLGLLLILY